VRNPLTSPLWSNSAFVRVWSAATISIFGTLITRVALPFAAIIVLGSGAIEVAVLRGLELGAMLLVGLVAGAWVDRLRRRPVLIWADLGGATLLGSIPLAYALGTLTYWHLLLVSVLAAVLTSFFDAADNAYLPSIVERERLLEANSTIAASTSAAEFVGFGISGFLVQVLSAPIAILIDAVTYLISALLLATIRRPEPPPPTREDREPVLVEIRDGLRREISFSKGQPSILDAASAAGLEVPYSCTSGVCGTCRAKLLEGEVRMERNFALDKNEVAAGFVLTCQSHPLTERVVLSFDER